MLPVHQKLLVYGFVTSALNENYDGGLLHIEYSMQMRAKNSDDEEWNYLNPEEPFKKHDFACDGADELCSYWPVGYVAELNYEMYDVAIQLKPSAELAKLEKTSINFHMAWVNPAYTAY